MNNSATGNGGAIYNTGANFSVVNSSFVNNTAYSGGAIYNNYGDGFSVVNSSFMNNSATNNGGAIYNSGGSLLVVDSNFSVNSASGCGGAVGVGKGVVNITGCNFLSDSAGTGNEIATIVSGSTTNITLYLNYNRIVNNRSGYAVYINDSSGNVTADIDYNWWGKNNYSSNVAPNNYYVMIFTNNSSTSGKKVGDNITVNYALVLNGTTDSSGANKLPYFTVTISDNGKVLDTIDGRENKTFNIPILSTNNTYNAVVDYENISLNVKASKSNTTIVISATTIKEGQNTYIKITLKDANGNPLANQTITIIINGKTYSATTDSNGVASFVISGLKAGNYKITANYTGDSNYFSTTASAEQIVKPTTTKTTITISSPTIKQGKKTNIKVTLKDENGKVIAGKKVTITFNGKTYTATTNSKGVATFTILGSKAGTFTITAKFTGDADYLDSSKTTKQVVKGRVDLAINTKKLQAKGNKFVYKIYIKNIGGKKSKKTTLNIKY
jgi:predicted outer membrane repeat protein